MAIYKLEEICDIKRGSSPRPIKKWLTNSSGLMWAKISDINDNKIMNTKEWVDLSWKNNALLGSYKDLFITNSATPGVAFIQKNKNFIAYHDGFLKIVPNEKFILKKYLLYKLINDRYKLIKMGNGAIFINLSSKILKNWQIKLISLKTQKQIIDIIEPYEKLFLSYSQCVRIDNISNTKKDIKNLIDIIEPLEKIIYTNNKIIKKIEYIIMNLPIKKTLEEDIFKKITTGKLNVNAINENGKYNFYSCSSKIKKTNFNSFKGRYILLSGNGEIYTWWYKGEFDLYQRVYALTEKRSFFTTFLSVKKGLDKIRKRSNGAVIKFIKLSDIKTIKMLNDNYENILKKMFIFQKKLEFLNEKIIILKNKFLNLLVK